MLLGVAVALLLISTGVSGATLVGRGRAVVAGSALVVGSLAGSAALAVAAAGGPHAIQQASAVTGGSLAVPVALVTYPVWRWRAPVDFLALAVTGLAGLLAVAFATVPAVVQGMGFASVLTVIGVVWWRLETAVPVERVPLQWLSVTLGFCLLVGGLSSFAIDGANDTTDRPLAIICVVCCSIGPAMAVGVIRPQVVDVRGLIVWTVVVFVTLIAYVAAFVGIVATLGVAGASPLSVGALGLIGAGCAAGFHPLIVLLRGVVDQLLFGDRPDPLVAASRVVDRIGDDPVLALRAIREALVLPYASLRVAGATLATSGTEVTHTRTLPLGLGQESVGEVVVGLRAGELGLAAADEQVLRIVAPLLAQTLRSRALAGDLRESRGAAIVAIEEERRRLRRDLHDGLGPTLSGVAFATDAARNQLRTDPDRADELLVQLRADTAGAIAEIRRLVEGLRPPVLDELGLVGAVVQHAAALNSAGGARLEVAVDVRGELPPLPAATEVAAYRIVVEALTNVVRHAAASSATVSIEVREGAVLALTVLDDGRTAGPWVAGVGLASMRERAEQVGGTLAASATAQGGRVAASIPVVRVRGR